MEIKTKYNIGSRVYLINDNRVDCTFVDSIMIEIEGDKVYEKYSLNSRRDWYDVSQLFPSKEELINSL